MLNKFDLLEICCSYTNLQSKSMVLTRLYVTRMKNISNRDI